MMNHGAMLWGAALYNNGAYPEKNYRFGQAYGADRRATKVSKLHTGHREDLASMASCRSSNRCRDSISAIRETFCAFSKKAARPQPSSVCRPVRNQTADPIAAFRARSRDIDRTDPVFLGLQKTRLHDPLLGFFGSNDHPGDYRSSGCSACHVVYANDRFADKFRLVEQIRSSGLEFHCRRIDSKNRARPSGHAPVHAVDSVEPVHELPHASGKSFREPVSRLHLVDQETDGELMYPKEQHNPTDTELVRSTMENPEPPLARDFGRQNFFDKSRN